MGAARAIEQAGERLARLLTRVEPAMPPTVGDTLKAAAAAFSVIPPSTAHTKAWRPASPSFALR